MFLSFGLFRFAVCTYRFAVKHKMTSPSKDFEDYQIKVAGLLKEYQEKALILEQDLLATRQSVSLYEQLTGTSIEGNVITSVKGRFAVDISGDQVKTTPLETTSTVDSLKNPIEFGPEVLVDWFLELVGPDVM